MQRQKVPSTRPLQNTLDMPARFLALLVITSAVYVCPSTLAKDAQQTTEVSVPEFTHTAVFYRPSIFDSQSSIVAPLVDETKDDGKFDESVFPRRANTESTDPEMQAKESEEARQVRQQIDELLMIVSTPHAVSSVSPKPIYKKAPLPLGFTKNNSRPMPIGHGFGLIPASNDFLRFTDSLK